MAGIGFELRKILSRRGYTQLLEAYIYAGVISSGPWLISIVGIALIGMLSLNLVVPKVFLQQFQVSVTYLFVFSLIFSGAFQFSYVRYIADRCWSGERIWNSRHHGDDSGLTLTSCRRAVVFFGFSRDEPGVPCRDDSSFVLLCNIR
jgi:uncharacterized membrane protein